MACASTVTVNVKAEQLIYTTANVRGKKGYQVVAKSRGIDDGIEASLRPHFIPPGIRPESLAESHSLVDLDGGNVAYCHARNIGAGYDGRRDTLCSHVLVVSRSAFGEIGYDTRSLAPLHPGNRRLRGILPPVELDPSSMPPLPSASDMRALWPIFAAVLRSLLDGERVAVPSSDPEMAQKFLSLLPPSARLVQFSSVAADAGRQTHCDLLFCPPGKKPRQSAGFRVVAGEEASDPANAGGGALGRAVRHYAEVALGGDRGRLNRIQDRFEGAPSLSGRDRMVLACAYERFLECDDELSKKECAEDAFSAIKKLDPPAFSRHFETIKDHVGPYRKAADEFYLNPKRPSDLFGAWLGSFPLAIGARMFGAFLDSYGHGGAPAGAGAGTGEAPAGLSGGSSDRGAAGPADARAEGAAASGGTAPRS